MDLWQVYPRRIIASESLTIARVQARRSAIWESRLTWTSLGRATGGGIDFRTACDDGQAMDTAVAEYVLQHAFRRADRDEGDDED